MPAEKAILSWSGGRESALALHEIRKSGKYEIPALLTTLSEDYDRIVMHGVRRTLLEQQADSVGLPLEKVFISQDAPGGDYESRMRELLTKYSADGVTSVVFGDVFLEDLRKYREDNLSRIGMKGVFPLWKEDTAELARRFIDSGFRAVIACVDTKFLDGKFAGRIYDEQFLSELPASVDPCGENGEFHSFVFDGPVFSRKIEYRRGKIVLRDNRFCFCDLLPAPAS